MKKKIKKQKWQGETCKLCKREQRIAWSVKNKVWNKIVNKRYKNKTLCLECFLKIADKKKINVNKKDFLFLGWVGNDIKGDILIDKKEDLPDIGLPADTLDIAEAMMRLYEKRGGSYPQLSTLRHSALQHLVAIAKRIREKDEEKD